MGERSGRERGEERRKNLYRNVRQGQCGLFPVEMMSLIVIVIKIKVKMRVNTKSTLISSIFCFSG